MGTDNLVKYNIDKGKLFKTTIAISVIYGVVAAALLAFSIFTGDASDSIASSMKPFIMTLMGGMVFILILLVIRIATFAPVSADIAPDSGYVCPDYWSLVKTPATDVDYIAANVSDQPNMTFQCVPNTSVYSIGTTDGTHEVTGSGTNTLGQTRFTDNVYGKQITAAEAADKTSVLSKLADAASKLYSSNASKTNASSNTNLRCDKVYPDYMAKKDIEAFPGSANLLRCEYSKRCRIPWTGVCPNY